MAQSAFKFSSEGLYNTSMSLARHILRTPSRVLARMRSLDAVLDYTPSPSASGSSAMHSDPNVRAQRLKDIGAVPIPGPWGFLTSGYFFGLFFMAFILNRVQNIVVPPRQPPAFQQYLRATTAGRRRSPMQSILRMVFPMNLSSTRSRFLFRIPSIFFLIRSLILWSLILAQGAGIFPLPRNSIPKALYRWAADMPMEDVCWSTFFAVCFALFISSLTSGMEGLYTSSNSPFNLFGYSFTLYIYGSPMTHTYRPKGAASRPDVHVLFTMIIPLLQLSMTHCLEVKQLWAKQRLIPTTICSLLSLSHFHLVMWFFPASYPLPTMVPNVVESFLLLVTATTCALNALTQLLLNGAITKPLFGHAETLKPKWDEDFPVVLFRLGTASLEATSVAGYGNEVGGITRPRGDLVLGQTPTAFPETTVEISRSGLVSVVDGTDSAGRRSGHKRGFTNEIRHVKASSGNAEVWADTLVNVAWHREMARFLLGLWRTMTGLGRILWAFIRGRPRQVASSTFASDSHDLRGESEPQGEIVVDNDVYERFLRGEDLSDEDDDAEFEPRSRQATFSSTSTQVINGEDDNASSEEDEDDREDNEEAVELYTDLSQTASTSASAPLLLAHMTDTSSSPLTRRRYANLIRIPDANSTVSSDEWSRFVEERRMSKRGRIEDEAASERRQTCVICTVEPREIVCWPCRCLALCDDCRENLASRSSASKHLCPCCRANVEGYSKIYIP